MKRKQKSSSYQQLINRIHAETKMRGWTLADTARFLGISHVYMTSLTCGARKLSGLSDEKQRALAGFLRVSMVEFYVMLGLLRPEDFVPSTPA